MSLLERLIALLLKELLLTILKYRFESSLAILSGIIPFFVLKNSAVLVDFLALFM
ncbi:hypothetical protein EGH67_09100 [Klebsiella aerogenes]|uniref:Uncharacterized protein n=1 Tax=Klebsiella aerogenes (strain ATCC 13048 / DSM 30053 / CCUG 1429 / JCM 1235 / KCTC 2190 / NBRC 13534 / NCIMB 10102 / NCTC 10006 / CDC 819-56) TaxID=1028307 RepID=A0A0H3FPQ4_KLEAK|nr:hypothetical protein EAE_13195 [Klebsiella aerogenes KCTC 2190]KAA0472370.1 hypothetical protein F0333_05930 [Klebsiella aerogenes]MBE0183187.1 hypothetical protein [Klebsiella aerogenes]MBE0246303.1 hypothetical protein [Klebsiella aerogenes]MBK1469569.1 hypothetical protein [Klebsiella aerogenes]